MQSLKINQEKTNTVLNEQCKEESLKTEMQRHREETKIRQKRTEYVGVENLYKKEFKH